MTAPTAPDIPPDNIDVLRAEREFLLRSLDDLDAELAAGDIAPARHRDLTDRYTARAADVIRLLTAVEDASAVTTPAPSEPRRGRRRAVGAAAAAIVAVVAIAGLVVMPRAVQDRPPGASITGNAQSQPASIESLARRAAARPDDPQAQLAYARALLSARDLVEALKRYDEAARLDPANPEPHAYSGWIVLLAGITDKAVTRIDAAIAADPSYPDAHFFKAVALRRLDRAGEAATELRRYLDLAAVDAPLRAEVESLLHELTTGTTTSTTATTTASP